MTGISELGPRERLRAALESHVILGQAQGILMERLNIDADAAFDHLRSVSRHSNRELMDVARDIVRSREAPDARP